MHSIHELMINPVYLYSCQNIHFVNGKESLICEYCFICIRLHELLSLDSNIWVKGNAYETRFCMGSLSRHEFKVAQAGGHAINLCNGKHFSVVVKMSKLLRRETQVNDYLSLPIFITEYPFYYWQRKVDL